MIDIAKQIATWRDGALEDWEVAQELVHSGRVRHGLFFAHLALEKMLKAHVCRQTGDLAPKLHNLLWLAERSGLEVDADSKGFLGEMNLFNLEGRYPDFSSSLPDDAEVRQYLAQTGGMLRWLTTQL